LKLRQTDKRLELVLRIASCARELSRAARAGTPAETGMGARKTFSICYFDPRTMLITMLVTRIFDKVITLIR